jgi:gliding motility-associated-like protein
MIVGLGTEVRLTPIIGGSLPIDSISWTPKDYLITSSEPLRPLVRPLDDRIYKLRVTDVNGCIGEAEISVELERNRNVFIPNVFSPNGDDKNDYFGVFSGVGVKQINYLRIYDRWGELVFQKQDLVPSNDPSQGWDGTFNNKPVQTGVYVYISEIVFEDGAKLLYRGDIMVAR